MKTDDADSKTSPATNGSSVDSSPASRNMTTDDHPQIPRRRLTFGAAPNSIPEGLVHDSEPVGRESIESPKASQTGRSCCNGAARAMPEPLPVAKTCCSAPKSTLQPQPTAKCCCSSKNTSKATDLGRLPVQHATNSSSAAYNINAGLNPLPFDGPTPPANGAPSAFPAFFDFSQQSLPQGPAFPQHFQPGLPSVHIPTALEMVAHPLDHDCQCGDGCQCFGCALHPRNKTTTDYILQMNEYMMESQQGQFIPHLAAIANGYGQIKPRNPMYLDQINTLGGPIYDQQRLQRNPPATNGHGHIGYPQQQVHGQWQSQHSRPYPLATPTQELEKLDMFNDNAQQSLTTSHPSTTQQNGAFGQTDYESSAGQTPEAINSPVLSPSAFFIQSLELPGNCTDVSGTCQCGDGCACVGCLTHGGHNGVPFDAAPESITDTAQLDGPFPSANPDFQNMQYIDTRPSTSHTSSQSISTSQAAPMYDARYMSSPTAGHTTGAFQYPIPAFAGGPG